MLRPTPSRRHQRSLAVSLGGLLDAAERCCAHRHFPAAARLAGQAALLSPARGRAWLLLGRVALARGEPDRAREHFVRAAALCPQRPGFRLAAGLALGGDRPGEALEHFRAAVSLCPSWVRARLALARALLALGCDEDAAYWAEPLLPEGVGPTVGVAVLADLDSAGWAELSSRSADAERLDAAA